MATGEELPEDRNVTAWVNFLAHVSDKDLARYIRSWEYAVELYGRDVMNGKNRYSHDSATRALAAAYIVQEGRNNGN